MKKGFSTLLVLLVGAVFSVAQLGERYTTWSGEVLPKDARAGEAAQLILTAKIKSGWHIYSMDKTEGPTPTSLTVQPNKALIVDGEPIQQKPKRVVDPNFEIEVGLYDGTAVFAIPVKVAADASGKQTLTVVAKSQACNERTCALPATDEVKIAFTVASGPSRADRLAKLTTLPAGVEVDSGPPAAGSTTTGPPSDDLRSKIDNAKGSGLASYLWLCFVFGFLALVTPCVFPMIPITVSFFSKPSGDTTKSGIGGPVSYCLGIIGTFTALGLVMTALYGASGISNLATNPFINIGLGVLFVVLAASLFGVFEIRMPSSLVNATSSKARAGGILAPLFMGLTFSLTSFTCTLPIVGSLLAGAAAGDYFYPILGMLAFSTAFSLPFFLLALFPQFLSKLPKSGSWMTTVKAFMGFLELAAAVKFFSNTDLVWQQGLLTKPVFLAIWATISFVAGMYLLGWILLSHEPTRGKIGWIRRSVGVATIGMGFFCLAGLQGRSLGELEAFLPPDPYPGHAKSSQVGEIKWIYDHGDAVAEAKSSNKPLFINFTGVTCTNCRWMEKQMFPRPDVQKELASFVTAELFTDRGSPGDMANQKLQLEISGTVTLPVYAVVSPDGRPIKIFQGSTRDPEEFLAFIRSAKQQLVARH